MSAVIKLPAEIASRVSSAPFPNNYEAARKALSQCFHIDEVRDVVCKSEALAIYARQSRDTTLETLSKRIRLRALERMGELLLEIEGSKNRIKAARAAKIGDGQRWQAVAIARCPKDIRDPLIDRSPRPADAYEINQANPGYVPRHRHFEVPSDFSIFYRSVLDFLDWRNAEKSGDYQLLSGMTKDDVPLMKSAICSVVEFLDEIEERIDAKRWDT